MSSEEKGFRVIDRRKEDSEKKPSKESSPSSKDVKGEGFSMSDKEKLSASEELNQIDFSTFIFSLATGALIHLGLAPDPSTKKTIVDIPIAKQNIDLLGILEEKTKGNLTKEESELLQGLLQETRLRFVEATKK